MEVLPADGWCNDSLREWEVVNKDYYNLMEAPKVQGESTLLRSARLKRAETKLAAAVIKADVASLVFQIMRATKRGTITLEIAEANMDVKLNWQ